MNIERDKPMKLRVSNGGGYKVYTCPVCCACYANEYSFKFSQRQNKEWKRDSFCNKCGQALDWSDPDE